MSGDIPQQFLALLEKAPEVEAMLDEQAGLWTVMLPPQTGWLVIFGSYSRLWWAYPLFPVRRRVILCADTPDSLIAHIDAADRELRIRPEHGEGQQP